MAGTDRNTANDIGELPRQMTERPYEFGLFSFLRIIECRNDEKPRLGESRRPAQDPIRIGQEPAITFESASLTAFQIAENEKPHRLTIRHPGLFGPNGPLPLHLTEYARKRMHRHGDPTFVRFLDIFHHRMISLFYRAWANNEPTISYDRPHADRFSDYVAAMAGLGMATLRKRDEIADLAKFYYCGRLSGQTKCAEGLEDILQDYFKMPVRIEPFVGEWLKLPVQNRCRLGRDPANGTLGDSAILGSRVWECQYKFRIVVGPLDVEEYENLLPVGTRIRRLIALVRNYIGDELAWDLKLILKRGDVPAMRLSSSSRLGWTTWLGKKPPAGDADDLVIDAFAFITRTSQNSEGFR
jgi:type VI secretion system protein ImpH